MRSGRLGIHMKRDTAQTIFRTVVFAGAMLGAGCSKKQTTPSTTPTNAAPTADPATTGTEPTGTEAATPDPCAGAAADPCAGGERPRGTDDDGGGGAGRGFVLS